MEALNNEAPSFQNLIHPVFNDNFKSHNSFTFKLVKTVTDFNQQLSQIYEQHGEQLKLLVSNFRRKSHELYKERASCSSSLFQLWESFLQQVEMDSAASSDIATSMFRQISRQLWERSFYRKIQSRKVFGHRESLETIIKKTEDKLVKCRQEYKDSFMDYLTTTDMDSLALYVNTHNSYVQQLHATNGMLEEFNKFTIPELLQELEDVYADLCSMISETMSQSSEIMQIKSEDQHRRYDNLAKQSGNINPSNDLLTFAKITVSTVVPSSKLVLKRNFIPLQVPSIEENEQFTINFNDRKIPILFKNELMLDRSSAVQLKPSYEVLKKEAVDLETQIKQIRDSLENLTRIQQKALESNLFNKVNDIQENISLKKFDLLVAQIHLSGINAQKDLFLNKLEHSNDTPSMTPIPTSASTPTTTPTSIRDGRMSTLTNHTMKSKWMKALKTLKTTSAFRDNERKEVRIDSDSHSFQEYTYKKITPCDICSQILRGHTRQGIRCKYCKTNVHIDCQDKVTDKCQPKLKLLRRQRSTSEIEVNNSVPTASDEANIQTSRRPKLNLRMKSFSLDSPESTDHVQRHKHETFANNYEPQSYHSSSSRLNSPSNNNMATKKHLMAKNVRISSVDIPDDSEKKSPSNLSPNHSPIGNQKKSQTLIPTNLHVVLYNFKARNLDELDLRAGYKVTVIDTSDPDWWKGKCFGKIGYFPSKYCTKLASNEKPLQVTHNLQVSDGDNGLMLLRDQIVIQIGEEIDGMVMIRSGDKRTGVCPTKYLQDI